MRILSWRAVTLSTAAFLLVAWGCGEGKPPVSTDTTEVTVKGTVTVNDKPATKGEVVFDPANYLRKDVSARKANIGADGTYTIKTLYGGNTVRVLGPDAEKAGSSYASWDCDAKEGMTFDIHLPKK
jgi:hypothetical protein